MDKKKDSSGGAKGTNGKSFTIPQVKELTKKDVYSCMLLMKAIYEDDDCLQSLAVFLHGRYMNHLHKQELENQTELKV